ncbi:MAG TPA: ATP-binding protein [Candidatus Saccharimonadales bacterium]
MDNIEQQPRRRNDHIKGSHADICLVKPTEWEEFLMEAGRHKNIMISGKNKLPAPIDHANLHYWAPSHESESGNAFELNAQIDFMSAMLPRDEGQLWQFIVLHKLEDTLQANGLTTYSLPHQVDHLYARISPDHLAHVTTSTEPDRCFVNVKLEPIDILSDTLDVNDDSALALPDTPYHILKSCLTVWSHTIDTVADTYGTPRNDTARTKRRISLSVEEAPAVTKSTINWPHPYPFREHLYDRGVKFDDIAGYDDIKDQLYGLVIQQKYPEIAQSMDLGKTQGILLHGVPGTAKTMLLKAFANEINAELITISASEIIEKWVGSSARNLDTYFEELVKRTDKVVVLMDEFDSLAVAADEASSGERVDTTNRLKEWVSRITESHHNIILTAATNNLDRIDPAVIRAERFLQIEVPVPDEKTRQEIWSLMIGKLGIRAALILADDPDAVVLNIDKDINAVKLAKETEGMVGAHFSAILNTIKRQRLLEYDVTGELHPLSQADILDEIEIVKDQD